MGKTCLVVIDLQRGFMSANTVRVVRPILQLIDTMEFDYVVATVFKNEPESSYVKYMGWSRMMDEEEQELVTGLEERCCRIFEKTGYTCFTKEFKEFMRKEKISHLFFVGVDLDCCVLKSACDSFELGIDFSVITDRCASNKGVAQEVAAKEILQRLVGSRQLILSNSSAIRKIVPVRTGYQRFMSKPKWRWLPERKSAV